MKKVYIIHGWEGGTHEKQLIWLKNKLIDNGLEVVFKDMPNTNEPKINEWVNYLNEVILDINEDIYLVGHSIGCQAIMRYMEGLPDGKAFGGVLFIAGFFNLTGLEDEEEERIAEPWLKSPIDFAKVKSHSAKFTSIFSDDDPFVPLDNVPLFEQRFNSQTIVLHAKGHLTAETQVEMPEVFEEIIKLVNVL